jgi:hypothetical protein
MQWFRFYHEALDDPKVQTLDGDSFKSWVNLLCLCAKQDGLPRSINDIAFALRMTTDGCQTVLQRLSSAGLLDKVSGGVDGMHYAIHSWEKRQYKSDSSTDRVKRFRERSSNGSETVIETRPDTETDTDTEQIKKHTKKKPPSVDGFDLFWNEYPRKVGRGLAVKAWSKAIAKTLPATIMDGLNQWKRSKDFPSEEKYIPHATTWLNAERWLDQILVDNSNSQRVTTEDERNHYMEESKKWLSEFRKNQSLTS